ncbi:succinyl-CoA synthetase beta subunit [Pseudaminobacter salicylatoxidans]|uniref:Succinyl-CoA synthetase beta subunit n=1 Tax=Pseudaminobacter salicylatoxidans TaxID=93369 RepID=A0A316C3G8_PSESE|nr:ADP-forming succinate--CoA ligase subunit beta [Pseudaminobacter salicylatoxidans]PWJ83793.1 succinyl-CoA synthetase beta subunit [Pseudaminobacter salicylatoxidans]
MKLQEFQAKAQLAGYGIAVPKGQVALTSEDALATARGLGSSHLAVKAQIQAGGRGLAGGVRLVAGAEEAAQAAGALLGSRLATAQTGPQGRQVRQVLVEEAIQSSRNLYLSLSIDAVTGEVVVLAGAEGSDNIEDRLLRGEARLESLPLGAGRELDRKQALELAMRIGLGAELAHRFADLLERLRRAFTELDATLIEINPLAVTARDEFVALDAKIILDDNALFRHPDLAALADEDGDEIEIVAQRRNLNYVRMDGNVGLVVNGAGLGLATLDMVRAANGRPANFMDIRTTATSLDVAFGFTLLLNNPAVRSILVNVHGGGMQPCDIIADGLGVAMRRTGRSCPTVVRLDGNNAEYARFRFDNFGCKVIDCPDMWTAATRAVAAANA